GLFVIRKTPGHGGKRNRKIAAVAGAHADRPVGAGLGADVARRRARTIVVAEQIVEETAGSLLLLQGIGVLRTAIVLRQRQQNRTPLAFAFAAAEAAAAQALEICRDLIEVCAHLLD